MVFLSVKCHLRILKVRHYEKVEINNLCRFQIQRGYKVWPLFQQTKRSMCNTKPNLEIADIISSPTSVPQGVFFNTVQSVMS